MNDGSPRIQFLKLATLFQGGLMLGSVVLGVIVGHPPWRILSFSWTALGVGVVATVPMLIFLLSIYQSPAHRLTEIREILHDVLGEKLIDCRWYDIVFLSLLAGFSEEFLFRGALEPWLATYHPWAGILVGNLIFGLCHAVTPTYFVLAAGIGLYLSLSLRMVSEPNLLVPITCHALYDFVAFIVIRNTYKGSKSFATTDEIASEESSA